MFTRLAMGSVTSGERIANGFAATARASVSVAMREAAENIVKNELGVELDSVGSEVR